MNNDWVLVFSSNLEYEIEILKMRLGEEGIVSFSLDKRDSAYRIGEVELYVRPEDALQAKQFITKRYENE